MHEKLPHLTTFVATALGLLIAVLLGNAIGSNDLLIIVEIVAIAVAVIWVVLGGHSWWLPMAFGLGIGGFFTIPYKVYPHEIALGFSLAALFPRIVLYRSSFRTGRPKLPLVFYILGLYLLAHFVMTLIDNDRQGAGNIARAYMNAMWAIIFSYYFWRFGSIRRLKMALHVVYLATLIRMVFGLVNYYANTVHVLPLINYSIDAQDLRASGSLMFILALLFSLMRGNVVVRVLNSFMLFFSVWVVLLGGSRGGVAMLLFATFFALAIFRKWMPLMGTGVALGLLVFWLNLNPRVLESLPTRATRAASILLVHEKLDVQQTARGSDEWHKELLPALAQNRWSHNARTMVFGTGVQPYRSVRGGVYEGGMAVYRMAELAADMGVYESAFWTLLAVLGVAGIVLYVMLLLWFARRILPALWNRKQRDLTWAMLFWAGLYLTQWFVFSIQAGGYPSWEIFLATIALAAVYDERAKIPASATIPFEVAKARRRTLPARAVATR